MSFVPQIGLEIEILIVYQRDTLERTTHGPRLAPLAYMHEEDRESAVVTPGQALWTLLNHAGVHTEGYEDIGEPPAESYSTWSIGEETLLLEPNELKVFLDQEGYLEEQLELKSRILPSDSNWPAEVKLVLEVLRCMENMYDCRIITNMTSGMHVHIGPPPPMRNVPLPVTKRVFQLVTAHEHNFDLVHATSRIQMPNVKSSGSDGLSWCMPPSFWHRSNGKTEAGQHNIFAWLRTIENCRSYCEQAGLTTMAEGGPEIDGEPFACDPDGHRAAYNFDNLLNQTPGERECKGTIEFRQHKSTLDYLEVASIIQLWVNVVNFCQTASDERFMWVLVLATSPEFGLEELLRTIGCDDRLVAHFAGGEAEVIGILPDVNAAATALAPSLPTHALDGLSAVSELNEGRRIDAENVRDKVFEKHVERYYGVFLGAQLLDTDEARMAYSLKLHLEYPDEEAASEEDRQVALSTARAELFRELADAYLKC